MRGGAHARPTPLLFVSVHLTALAKRICLCVFSTLLLFCGFQWNLWRVADRKWFLNHQRDMESQILGRLVKSRQAGLFSAGGLTGFVSPDARAVEYDDEPFEYQYAAYRDCLAFGAYTPYMSHVGGQGLVFGLLDAVIGISPRAKLELFHAFTSLLSAVVLATVVLWFYREFGLPASMLVLASAVLTPWLTVFGRNLWWCIWAFYLPMAAVMHFLRRSSNVSGRRAVTFGTLVFATVLVKCLITGYEYITTALIMALAPFVYYAVLRRHTMGAFLRGALAAFLGECLAVGVSVAILCVQVAAVKGSAQAGLEHMARALKKRTYADARNLPPPIVESLKSSPAEVLEVYLTGTFFDAGNYLPARSSFVSRHVYRVRYWYLIALFLLASVAVRLRANKHASPEARWKSFALTSATWFSILAPVSWFLIFKAHSYIHTGINFITWQMPFTLFGFALVALAIKRPPPLKKVAVEGGSAQNS